MTPPTATSDTIQECYDLGIVFEPKDSTTSETLFSAYLASEASTALSQLDTIAQLPGDWDSYGSPQLSDELYLNAKKLIHLIQDRFVPQSPDVVPVSGGGVQFEWQSAGRELEIEFSNPDEVAYLKVFEDERMEEGVFPIEDLEIEVERLIAWLFSN